MFLENSFNKKDSTPTIGNCKQEGFQSKAKHPLLNRCVGYIVTKFYRVLGKRGGGWDHGIPVCVGRRRTRRVPKWILLNRSMCNQIGTPSPPPPPPEQPHKYDWRFYFPTGGNNNVRCLKCTINVDLFLISHICEIISEDLFLLTNASIIFCLWPWLC